MADPKKTRKPVDPQIAEQVNRVAKQISIIILDTLGMTLGWDLVASFFNLPMVGPHQVFGALLLLVCLKAEVMGLIRSK